MELDFRNNNPGSVLYGNFINYYKFHSPETRIDLLPTDIWKTLNFNNKQIICLDIGCNSGDLTIALHEFLSKQIGKDCHFLGIDIDPTLIQRAEEKNTNSNLTFKCMNVMDEAQRLQTFKNLEINSKFDISFCFSVTMWIHLNYGDKGLKEFLYEICKLSKILVIEPQPWKCYKTAVKRLRLGNEKFPFYHNLQIKGNIEETIEEIISNFGAVKLHESQRTNWQRKILIFNCSKV